MNAPSRPPGGPSGVDARSKSRRALDCLQAHPGVPVTLDDLAAAIGYPATAEGRAQASTLVSPRAKRAGPGSPWRHVHQVGRGLYVYDPARTAEAEPEGAGWAVVDREAGVLVLRSPDGSLYLARPLGGGSSEPPTEA